ncbi:18140_t:CDS:2, partial [Gigaspora rosea]
ASQYDYNEFSLDSTLNSQQTLDSSQLQFTEPELTGVNEINTFHAGVCYFALGHEFYIHRKSFCNSKAESSLHY